MLVPGEAQYAILTLTVIDSSGETARDTLIVTIRKNNMAPTAVAGNDMSVIEGCIIRLLQSEASDPDGDPVSFYWKADSGSFDDPYALHPFYCAPILECEEQLYAELTLVVTDSFGNSTSDRMTIVVQNRTESGGYYRRVVTEGDVLQLSAMVTDVDGDALFVVWSASSGHFDNPYAIDTFYVAPVLPQNEECRNVDIYFRVEDSCGNSSEKRQQIVIYPAPALSLVVDAGPAILVSSTSVVTLDTAEVYDPYGGEIRIVWNIVRGCGSILGEITANPTVLFCPDSSNGSELLLRVSAIDECGNEAVDDILVVLDEEKPTN